MPVVLSILLSFTNFNMLQFPDFVFIDNYIRLFLDDDLFVKALQNTMIFACHGPTSYVISFLVAWFINGSAQGRSFRYIYLLRTFDFG